MYFRKSCDAYYVNVPSDTKPGSMRPQWLGASKVEAEKNLALLTAGRPIVRPIRGQTRKRLVLTVQEVVDAFLDAKQSDPKVSEKTYGWYRTFLHSFCDVHGSLAFTSLDHDHVQE